MLKIDFFFLSLFLTPFPLPFPFGIVRKLIGKRVSYVFLDLIPFFFSRLLEYIFCFFIKHSGARGFTNLFVAIFAFIGKVSLGWTIDCTVGQVLLIKKKFCFRVETEIVEMRLAIQISIKSYRTENPVL